MSLTNQIASINTSRSPFYCGYLQPNSQDWVNEPLWDGLKLIFIMEGDIECRIQGQDKVAISGPRLCAVANRGEGDSEQRFLSQKEICYVSFCLDHELIEQLEISNIPLFSKMKKQGPKLWHQPANRALSLLAQQMIHRPLTGPLGDLFLSGKMLEFCALSLHELQQPRISANTPKLSTNDIEALHYAKSLLLDNLATPPTFYQISKLVGLNIRKLNYGFQQLFNTTLAGFLQEARLQAAQQMLAVGGMQIASIAWQVGYSPAHFSTLFRKRFGISPSELS